MKLRSTTAGAALGARLTAVCWGALILLVPAAVAACSSNSTSTPTVPTFTPTVSTSATTAPASAGSTPGDGSTTSPGTPGETASSPAPHTATATATATVTITPGATASASKIPSAAPVTGGGGTAGLQDGMLFGVGAAAILAGAGSIVYRRRLTRDR